jgi:hypothetical protein
VALRIRRGGEVHLVNPARKMKARRIEATIVKLPTLRSFGNCDGPKRAKCDADHRFSKFSEVIANTREIPNGPIPLDKDPIRRCDGPAAFDPK